MLVNLSTVICPEFPPENTASLHGDPLTPEKAMATLVTMATNTECVIHIVGGLLRNVTFLIGLEHNCDISGMDRLIAKFMNQVLIVG